jgi:tRNA1Val (adenine37-N6)-methyltransferase
MQKNNPLRRSWASDAEEAIAAKIPETSVGEAAPHPAENPRETLDTLFGGQLRLYQSSKGYRVSLDAVLLAHFVSLTGTEKIVDLGTGNAVIPLILALLHASISITGVELQESMRYRAHRNIRLNGFAGRVNIARGDVRSIEQLGPQGSFDAVTCNPPYRNPRNGRLSLDAEKKVARHEMHGTLDDFIRAGAYLLAAKGRMALVYRGERIVDLLQAMRCFDVEPKRLRLVHSFLDGPASLVLVEGRKGSRSGMKTLAPLIVYDTRNAYTAEVEKMLAGGHLKTGPVLRVESSGG